MASHPSFPSSVAGYCGGRALKLRCGKQGSRFSVQGSKVCPQITQIDAGFFNELKERSAHQVIQDGWLYAHLFDPMPHAPCAMLFLPNAV
jgi:hypothetical protein